MSDDYLRTSPPPIQNTASWGSSGQLPHHLYRIRPRGGSWYKHTSPHHLYIEDRLVGKLSKCVGCCTGANHRSSHSNDTPSRQRTCTRTLSTPFPSIPLSTSLFRTHHASHACSTRRCMARPLVCSLGAMRWVHRYPNPLLSLLS